MIEKVIETLGLQKKRAAMIQRFSREYLDDSWTHVTQLHGIGKYVGLFFPLPFYLITLTPLENNYKTVFMCRILSTLRSCHCLMESCLLFSSFIGQIRSRCICNILFRRLGPGGTQRPHAGEILELPL